MSQNILEHLDLLVIARSYPEDLITAKKKQKKQSSSQCQFTTRIKVP